MRDGPVTLWRTVLRLLVGAVLLGCAIIVYGSYAAQIVSLLSPAAVTPESPLAQENYRKAVDAFTGNHGMTPDLPQALLWMQRSAQQGSAAAQFALGNVYDSGVIGQDHRKAFIWFSLAAEHGYPKAAALRYETGAFLSPAEWQSAKREIAVIRAQMNTK